MEVQMPVEKVCRFCGSSGTNNVNIFQHPKLLAKIVTIYPIVLYQNDPLPKEICVACTKRIGIVHATMERVLTTHNKWINDIRLKEPGHIYLNILDSVHNANNTAKASIKKRFGEELCKGLIDCNAELLINYRSSSFPIVRGKKKTKDLSNNSTVISTQQWQNSSNTLTNESKSTGKESTSATLSIDSYSIASNNNLTKANLLNAFTNVATISNIKKGDLHQEIIESPLLHNFKQNSSINFGAIPVTKETQIKPLVHIPLPIITRDSRSESKEESLVAQKSTTKIAIITNESNESVSSEIQIKKEVGISELQNSTARRLGRPRHVPPPLPLGTVKCRYCDNMFISVEMLATHQLIHLRLDIPKLFLKKILAKDQRRGRLIKVQGQDCIRCLNCWSVFTDSSTILEHWTIGNCDFYCQVCLKEFQLAPKQLREHLISIHGISYRSSRSLRNHFSAMTSKKKENISIECIQSTSKRKTIVDRQTCPTCKKVFQNIKARNSHMRLHTNAHILKFGKKSIASKFSNSIDRTNNYSINKGESKTTLMKLTNASTNSFGYVKVKLVSNPLNASDIIAQHELSNVNHNRQIPAEWLQNHRTAIVVKEEPMDNH